ncbi:TrmB family transcriptional regulator [Breoghania sp.]|uniref:TrmB family transcriptional regulator n=1 Tax=Breoghania sp. TaxID=2065378 RepID=UPI0026034216|nr:TrmB family transcriptional regulator [Breoghania sp.]MDJ0933522.1 helix-turn-helix domain-containing protein [Breoghania sp.]
MTSLRMTELTNALGQLGFSLYEARAYCALLERARLNGHEVAKSCGVPTSKIYETLDRLADKGAVMVQHGEPKTYVATPYEDVLARVRSEFHEALETATNGLCKLPSRPDTGEIWSLKNYKGVLTASRSRIQAAQTSLFAAFWDAELTSLKDDLESASARGVAVYIAVYGHTQFEGPCSYDLSLCGDRAAKRLGGHRLSAVIADEEDALVAIFQENDTVDAVATTNTVISLLAIEYIRADLMGRLLINELGEDRFAAMRERSDDFHRLL